MAKFTNNELDFITDLQQQGFDQDVIADRLNSARTKNKELGFAEEPEKDTTFGEKVLDVGKKIESFTAPVFKPIERFGKELAPGVVKGAIGLGKAVEEAVVPERFIIGTPESRKELFESSFPTPETVAGRKGQAVGEFIGEQAPGFVAGGLAASALTKGATALAPTIASTLAGRAALGAGQLAAFETGRSIISDQDLPTATELATSAAIGAALPVAGAALKAIGGKAVKVVLPVSEQEAKAAQKAAAGLGRAPRALSQTAIERGVTGTEKTIGVKAEKVSRDIFQKEIEPALKSIKKALPKKKLFDIIQKKIDKVVEPGRKRVLTDGFNALKDDFAKIKSTSFLEWQKIKSGLDQFAAQKLFKGKDVAQGYNQIRHELADAVRQETYSTLSGVGIRNKYLDFSNLIELKKLGIASRTGAKFKGGLGRIGRGLLDKVVVPIGTVGGRVLYKVGEGLEFVAPKGFKTLGDYVSSRGIDKATFSKALFKPRTVKGITPTFKQVATPKSATKKLTSLVKQTKVKSSIVPKKLEGLVKEASVKGMPKELNIKKDGSITIEFIKNPKKAPRLASDKFLQKVEPAGEFFTVKEVGSITPAGFQEGTKTFKNPLIIEHISSGEGGWKRILSNIFGGKKGKSLSKSITNKGFDGIVTIDDLGGKRVISESISLK